MAGRKAKQRVEPRLGESGGIRVEARDRPAGGASQRKPKAKTAKSRSSAPRRKKARGSGGGFLRRTVYWGSVLAVWGLIAVVGIIAWYGVQMPPTSEWRVPERPPNVRILAVDGALIGNRGDTGGQAVKLAELPDYVPEAVIAIEDHRFRQHFGVDPIGLSRAVVRNLVSGGVVQGGSTLTQQLAKNMFLTPERSIRRKIQEMLLALWLEHKYSKGEILEMYLNRVYFGGGAYGVDAAAHRFFAKDSSDLNLAEAAMLAGLVKAPSHYQPDRNFDAAEARARLVLDAMVREDYVTAAQAKYAKENPPRIASRHRVHAENYVADFVMDRLPSYVGAIDEDVTVYTTIDLSLEREAEKALVEGLKANGEKYGVHQGALVALDGTGAIRAMVGGRSYDKSQFNRAVQAKRQPGSSFKPFVYLTALEQGLRPETVRVDQPVRIGNWEPHNYSNKYEGPVTLKTALARSLNTVAAQLAAEVGPKNVVATAHRMGISSDLKANATIALGTSEVSLLELTGAYAPLANGGFAVLPHAIERVVTDDGETLFQRSSPGLGRVVDLRIVAMMNEMMKATLEIGTGRKAQIPGWPAGGKTGTSQDWRDAWFVGYTANLTAGVWVGNDDNSPTKKASGGNVPSMIWADFMKAAHRGVAVAALPGEGLYSPAIAQNPGMGQPSAAGSGGDAQYRDWILNRDSDRTHTGPARPQRGNGGQGGIGGFFGRIFGN
ncbi:penicillin-binding protein 1A [Rhodopseudomonas julia]|uniref:peptidoglycan glycosyltransferase n=1 Tax=Rhodopseudomonas julia TaxID=200617 RepID=A0ABU0C8E4_9BRAD|nr:penicillin-binding protein 1A [Rhodopseudomonas julia]MDQ0325327.1 penicillin-binding protein 1A [Rhodopseudomonas julia]